MVAERTRASSSEDTLGTDRPRRSNGQTLAAHPRPPQCPAGPEPGSAQDRRSGGRASRRAGGSAAGGGSASAPRAAEAPARRLIE